MGASKSAQELSRLQKSAQRNSLLEDKVFVQKGQYVLQGHVFRLNGNTKNSSYRAVVAISRTFRASLRRLLTERDVVVLRD